MFHTKYITNLCHYTIYFIAIKIFKTLITGLRSFNLILSEVCKYTYI